MSLPSGIDPNGSGVYRPDGKGGYVIVSSSGGSQTSPPGKKTGLTGAGDPKKQRPIGGASGDATPTQDLTGPQRNAYEALKAVFESYDLGTLAPKVKELLLAGYDQDTISYMLQQTTEWKDRFSGNEKRKSVGLAVLSPAEYLATERAYRQVLVAHGAPTGFYDQHSDFADWIGNDVSASEIDNRAKVVSDHVNNADPNWMLAFKQFYNGDKSSAWAYFLDPAKGADLINQRANALSVGAAAMDQGLQTDVGRAEGLASQGVTEQQAKQGYSQIGGILPALTGLSNISGDISYNQSDAENEVFNGLASATRKRQQLSQQEADRFSGGSGAGSQSFGRRSTPGSY